MKSVEDAQYHDESHGGDGHSHHGDGGDDVNGVGGFLREYVASRYVEWKVHRRLLCLFLEQLVDALNIIERVVHEEAQFGDDTQLVAYACAKLVADGLLVGCDVAENLVSLLRREHAEVSGENAEVGRHAATCYADHYAVHGASLRLEDKAQLLLEQACYTVLSCFLHKNCCLYEKFK